MNGILSFMWITELSGLEDCGLKLIQRRKLNIILICFKDWEQIDHFFVQETYNYGTLL
jgi:hypothetical protein